jgi:selenocysteine lyase/cysteine desulfurase
VYDVRSAIKVVHDTLGKIEDGGPMVLLDACQSAGQLELDVSTLGCDALAATSRKWLRGPRGAGFLFVRGAVLDGAATNVYTEPGSIDLFGATWTVSPRQGYALRLPAPFSHTFNTTLPSRHSW